jgi:hypothetical protein
MREFDDRYMLEGFGKANRSPASSRVSKTYRSAKLSEPVKKGLSRKAVSVKRVERRKWRVFNKCGGDYFATIELHHMGYGFTLRGESKPYCGFNTLKQCVDALLLKV